MSRDGYSTPCVDGRRDFVDIQEALHYHALANGDGCWRDLLSHAAVEISRLRAESERLRQALRSGMCPDTDQGRDGYERCDHPSPSGSRRDADGPGEGRP